MKDLKLSSDKFAPKVVAMFEEARADAERAGTPAAATTRAPKKGRSKVPFVLLGVAGAATAVGVAAAGGSPPAPSNCSSGQFTVSNARFDVPEIDCTGRSGAAHGLNYLFEAVNSSKVVVAISSVASRFALATQSGAGNCISFDDGALTFSPPEVQAGAQQTITVFRGGYVREPPHGGAGKL